MAGMHFSIYTSSNQLAVSNNINTVLINATDQPTLDTYQAPDSKCRNTHLDALKKGYSIKEKLVQTGSTSPHSQVTGKYANAKIPYQLRSF